MTRGGELSFRSTHPRRRWLFFVTAGEALGFVVPASVGVVVAMRDPGHLATTLILATAGLAEGALLGTGQAFALPVAVDRRRYVLWSAVGAGVAWLTIGGTMPLVGRADLPAAVTIPAFILGATVGLLAIGGAQAMVLRRHVDNALSWIGWTALAWMCALPMSFLPSPFVDESTPVAVHVPLWSAAGLLMAFTMAVVTWQGAKRLRPRSP